MSQGVNFQVSLEEGINVLLEFSYRVAAGWRDRQTKAKKCSVGMAWWQT